MAVSVRRDNDVASVLGIAKRCGLDAALLYETVIELSNEGLLTAGCVNHAAEILLTRLGLPEYFFHNISRDALKRVLRAIGGNVYAVDGRFILRGAVSEVRFDVDDGVQVRIATEQNRDSMEKVLDAVMTGSRVEYYFGHEHRYYTYIIRPDTCPEPAALQSGDSPFAFASPRASYRMPEETRLRYQHFLDRALESVVPLIEVSETSNGGETRIMFRDDFDHSALPLLRRIMEDHGARLNRVYWETFRNRTGRVDSICSLYVKGKPSLRTRRQILACIQAALAIHANDLDALFIAGDLSFEEYLFALNAFSFVHVFIHKNLPADREIMEGLARRELREAMARRIFEANRNEYTRKVIFEAMRRRPDLVKELFAIFDGRFNPSRSAAAGDVTAREIERFRQKTAIAFIDDRTARDIFVFMARLVTGTYKTNFYAEKKRSFAFRLDPSALDPLVFSGMVYGVFFINGFYATATHMRADDVARGGVRLIRVTPDNYENELDAMPLLNYALGPVAQRLKHKDIAESGAKGVIVPFPPYAGDGLNAMFDFSEGIMDLIQPSDEVIDRLGRPEMMFFGPDEGTAGFMDAVAFRAKDRGYPYWRTITTGKSFGIPHDTYGLLNDRRVFGLVARGERGTELLIDGASATVTTDMDEMYRRIGDRIVTSGMTTMGVTASFRAVLDDIGLREEEIVLAMTGGPDGDLGANQIQSFKGRIGLIVDGGSVLFDPRGLDRVELMKLAFARHTRPRLTTLAYPDGALGPEGFKVPRVPGALTLSDGTVVEDGAFFHRNFLTDPAARRFLERVPIQAFIPCGGFKDTINAGNVRDFLSLFRELRVIIEGANVFFDDTARDIIARETAIVQIRDSSANKGGVTSSSLAEVLGAFLLGDDYEAALVNDASFRSAMIRAVFDLIAGNAAAETKMLLALHRREGTPLHLLSTRTSEELFALQRELLGRIDLLSADRELVDRVLAAYIPAPLFERVGANAVRRIFDDPRLVPYRDAVITKKLAAMALYRHAAAWNDFLARLRAGFSPVLRELLDVPD